MTPQQIAMIKNSFAGVAGQADEIAAQFYARLFELDPSLRAMFRGDMGEQGKKLMTTLKIVVNSLERLEAILPAVQELGRRHAAYHVRDAHYDTVGAALLWTLRKASGEQFTPEVEAAWTTAYTLLADTMKLAAAEMMLQVDLAA